MIPGGPPHVFVDDLRTPVLTGEDHHHLVRVLRVRRGDPVTASDGRGSWRECRLGRDAVLEPVGEPVLEPRPQPEVGVGFALIKGGRPELVVQKLTELGVDDIRPFTAARSVVRWDDDRRLKAEARLERVAREAAMQSRRAWLPRVHPVTGFAELAAREGAALAERGGDRPGLDRPLVLVGPEGGWSDEERARGLPRVALAEGVLRAETAAIVAGALLVALRSGLIPGS